MIAGWVIGVLLSMVGSVIDNIGITMQKYSHLKNSWLPKNERIIYYKQKIWWAGFSTFLVGNLVNVVGLGFTTQVLFAAIGGVSLVANAINSHFILGEPFNRRMFLGTLIIIGGSSLAVNFGSHAHEDFDLHDLEHFFDLSFIVYGSIVLSMLVVLLLSIHFVKFFAPQEDGSMGLDDEILQVIVLSRQVSAANSDEAMLPSRFDSEAALYQSEDIDIGRPAPLSKLHRAPSHPDNINIRVKNIETVKHYQDQEVGSAAPSEVQEDTAENDRLLGRHQFLSFAYPAFSGLIGSFTVLLAKCTAELVRVSLRGRNQFDSPVPFFMVLGTLVCGTVQVHYIQLGLRAYDQLVVISVYYVIYTTFSIFGGVFYFNEFHKFSIAQIVVFPLATVVTFFGVYLISTNPESYKAQQMRLSAGRNMDSEETSSNYEFVSDFSPTEQSAIGASAPAGYNSLDHVEDSDEMLFLHCIRCGTPHHMPPGTMQFTCSWCGHLNKQLSGCTVL